LVSIWDFELGTWNLAFIWNLDFVIWSFTKHFRKGFVIAIINQKLKTYATLHYKLTLRPIAHRA
jgi:hypothetical protein